MQPEDPKLTADQEAALTRLQANSSLDELVRAFPDPADAFVCSPVPISMRQLALLYGESVAEEVRHRFPADLRERSRRERWVEKRAVFQAKRTTARRDAILAAEAEVWAIFGLEFHSRRIRALWERWEALSAYVQDGLEQCESGEMIFGTALRDACRELSDIEKQLEVIMPQLGLPTRAQEVWTGKAGSRESMIARIEERLHVAGGSRRAGTVFELVVNDQSSEEGG